MAKLLVPKQAARVSHRGRGKWHLPKPWRCTGNPRLSYEVSFPSGASYSQVEYETEHNDKPMASACGRGVSAQGDLAEGYSRETANIEDIEPGDICKACLGPMIALNS